MRGLKLEGRDNIEDETGVAPRVGAWIETGTLPGGADGNEVAPRVGAWIETCFVTPRSKPKSGRTPSGCVD